MFGVPDLAVLVSLFEMWLDEARAETHEVAATGDGGGQALDRSAGVPMGPSCPTS
jgi:hypothetical protein